VGDSRLDDFLPNGLKVTRFQECKIITPRSRFAMTAFRADARRPIWCSWRGHMVVLYTAPSIPGAVTRITSRPPPRNMTTLSNME
jgi:hypothetical protein